MSTVTSSVVISDLPSLGTVSDSDLMLVRSGGTDYQATASRVRSINIPGFSSLPSIVQPSDVMMISQGGNNYKIPFNQVGFIQNTKMWFYCTEGTAPSGWTIDDTLTDCLLSVAGGSTYTTGATVSGSWQQPDHTLTASEIGHYHYPFTSNNQINTSLGGNIRSINAYKPPSSTVILRTADVTDQGSAMTSTAHNHGSTYRPYAAVGFICVKDQ